VRPNGLAASDNLQQRRGREVSVPLEDRFVGACLCGLRSKTESEHDQALPLREQGFLSDHPAPHSGGLFAG
jgi:hypothetical protein